MTAAAANKLPDRFRDALLAELHPGESLRWCSAAHGVGWSHANRESNIFALLFAALFAALLFGVSIWWGLLYLEAIRLAGNNSFELPGAVVASFSLGVLTVVITLAASIRQALIRRSLHMRLAYAVSDRRIFTLHASRRGRVCVVSQSPPPRACLIELTHLPGGHSNIAVRSFRPRPLIFLIGVLEPRAAISAIRHMRGRERPSHSITPRPI